MSWISRVEQIEDKRMIMISDCVTVGGLAAGILTVALLPIIAPYQKTKERTEAPVQKLEEAQTQGGFRERESQRTQGSTELQRR